MDSFQRFNETQLPAQRAFYNDLNGETVSDQDYAHAEWVWDTFKIKNLGDYHDLYMETDVHLLADVFENFRSLCLEIYGLDAAHFYTAPGLAWQAALKMTCVELELLTDPDMHLFLERGLRGGISTITKRHAKANNTYLDEYDTEQASTYIIYLDANNLYGWAMSQSLPTHDFEWLTAEDLLNLDVSSIPDDGDQGYILEVDLEYPHHLHDYHNDYPLAPESFEIQPEMLSPYQQALLTDLGMKTTGCNKLVPNLYDKKNYVVHYRNLQMYLSMGLQLTKVHRVLKFQQSPWLKPYIDFNTSMRKQANNEFEKDFFKLMNNSVFGKTMENLRKRVDIQLVHHEKRLLKLTKKPGFKVHLILPIERSDLCKLSIDVLKRVFEISFQSFKIFNDDLASIELHKQKLVLNRPIYVGFSVLDLSKTLMYDFHYNYVKSKYGSRAQLLFTDTDSLCYEITTDDLYHDLKDDKELFDFSAYPRNHSLYDASNKKIIGKMKDETESVPVKEFVGLRSKMYSMVHGNTEKRTAKGISKAVIRSKLRHDLYKQCLFNRETQMEPMILFRTDRHEIYTVKLNKTTLSAYDDKRYILEDGIQTLAHGHWRCQKL